MSPRLTRLRPPLLVASWFMPLIVAVGRRPWADAITIYPGSLLVVASGILAGHAALGLIGAAAGSVAGTLVCPVLQLIVLRRSGVIQLRHAMAIVFLVVLATAALAAVGLQVHAVR